MIRPAAVRANPGLLTQETTAIKAIAIILIVLGALILLFAFSNLGTAFFLSQAIFGFTLIGFGCIIICLTDIRDILRARLIPPTPAATASTEGQKFRDNLKAGYGGDDPNPDGPIG